MQDVRTRPYTLKQAAQEMGVSYQHLWRLVRRGEVPHSKLGSKVLIPSRVVQAIQEGEVVEK